MNKCPACDREFRKIRDYPFVSISELEKLMIPDTIQFPIEHAPPTYVSQNSQYSNPRPPQEVLDYFEKHGDKKHFAYGGWTWNSEESQGVV